MSPNNGRRERTRRSVLALGAKAAAALGAAQFSSPLQAAASGNSALVCLYLLGGNDSNNMIVPLDSPGYDAYARGRGPLSIPREDLLGVSTSNSGSYGFHPNLPGLRDLYKQGSLAVLANVGRSEAPLTRAQAKAGPLPPDLFEHARDPRIRYVRDGFLGIPWAASADGTSVGRLRHGISMLTPPSLSRQHGDLMSAVKEVSLRMSFPLTFIGQQMQTIAQALKSTGVNQQAFVCPVSGFDTHSNQLATQGRLYAELDEALTAFSRTLNDLGISNRVTLFTRTEFNRALRPNATGGTDHGWGGHELVFGGSTIGGQIYGRFPSLELGGSDDLGSNGVWVPGISDLQYSATIARWFGRTDLSGLPEFAGLSNFSVTDLGFLAG